MYSAIGLRLKDRNKELGLKTKVLVRSRCSKKPCLRRYTSLRIVLIVDVSVSMLDYYLCQGGSMQLVQFDSISVCHSVCSVILQARLL